MNIYHFLFQPVLIFAVMYLDDGSAILQ
jgi:hypothetical protein